MSVRVSRSAAESLGLAKPRARESRSRRQRGKGQTTPEGAVLKACLALLALRSDVVALAWRNNVGCLPDATGRPVRYGKVGSSDILGVLVGGRALACECKAPGKAGDLTPAQAAFLDDVRNAGGVAIIVDDVQTLAEALDRLAVDPGAAI